MSEQKSGVKRWRFGRRVYALMAVALMMFGVLGTFFFNEVQFARAAAGAARTSLEQPNTNSSVELMSKLVSKPDANQQIYFEKTGHYLSSGFLYYWRVNNGMSQFGMPISEEMTEDGRTVQYFEKARLEYHEEFRGSRYETSLGQLGRETLNADQFALNQQAVKRIEAKYVPAGFRYFPETGHTLVGRWRDMWEHNGGLDRFGYPLTEQFQRNIDGVNYTVQIFERVEMRFQDGAANIILAPLGYNVADLKAVNTSRINYDGTTALWSPKLYEHWVDVNLRTQTARFMEGDLAVRTSLVTTGKPGHATPTGTFYINRRVYNETMVGGQPGTEDYYRLENVLYTQYFTYEGHALHYAWWRSQFGVTGSHGCVNEDLATAKFAWDFLNIGSRVSIHY